MNINNGETHKILFSKGKLYLDGIQIGGDGVLPEKDIAFEFKTNTPPVEPVSTNTDPSILEVNVYDKVAGKSVGPGQQ